MKNEKQGYEFPPTNLLTASPSPEAVCEEEQHEVTDQVTGVLKDLGIEVTSVEIHVGPAIMRLECEVKSVSHISKAKKLKDDIAMCLACLGCRIISPIPGKVAIGLEILRKNPQIISMRSVVESNAFNKAKESMELPFAVGGEIGGAILFSDLARTPHLLVAGATGMGKSVFLNSLISSLLYAKTPEDLKFVLIDPKMIEFSLYSDLKNTYLAEAPNGEPSIINDPSNALEAIHSLNQEMDDRYDLLRSAKTFNIKEYNEKYDQNLLSSKEGHHHLSYIVAVVDEFADLFLKSGRKEVEPLIVRIAQRGRAAGIHLVLATQRPSSNIITGCIKANFPGRVAFRVFQRVDSKTILDQEGADRLIGRGDLLFYDSGEMRRIQSPYITSSEIEKLVRHIAAVANQEDVDILAEPVEVETVVKESENNNSALAQLEDYKKCLRFVCSQAFITGPSMLQRKLQIGYNKACHFIKEMEALGIIAPEDKNKHHKVLKTFEETETDVDPF